MINRTGYQLLCTFSTPEEYTSAISSIKQVYFLPDKTIFIFENVSNKNEVIMTYNVKLKEIQEKFPLTISIHRKKETGTLYTINSLNCIVKEENNGVIDRNFKINWELYKNCLIITNDIGYKVVNLNLVNIVRF